MNRCPGGAGGEEEEEDREEEDKEEENKEEEDKEEEGKEEKVEEKVEELRRQCAEATQWALAGAEGGELRRQ